MKTIRCVATVSVCLAVMLFGGCQRREDPGDMVVKDDLTKEYRCLLRKRLNSVGGANFDEAQMLGRFEGLSDSEKEQEIEKLRHIVGSAE